MPRRPFAVTPPILPGLRRHNGRVVLMISRQRPPCGKAHAIGCRATGVRLAITRSASRRAPCRSPGEDRVWRHRAEQPFKALGSQSRACSAGVRDRGVEIAHQTAASPWCGDDPAKCQSSARSSLHSPRWANSWPHEQQLLAGIAPHAGVIGAQIGELLPVVTGILASSEPLPWTTSSWLSGSTKFSRRRRAGRR